VIVWVSRHKTTPPLVEVSYNVKMTCSVLLMGRPLLRSVTTPCKEIVFGTAAQTPCAINVTLRKTKQTLSSLCKHHAGDSETRRRNMTISHVYKGC
jgi:hypothetical protein